MADTLRVQGDAQRELDEAIDWYEDRASRGEHFARAVRETFARIAERAASFPVALGTRAVRHAPVRGYPYRVFFVTEPDEILVVAVAHSRRRPLYWRRRVRRK